MLKEAIFHRPKNNFAYAYDHQTVHLRLRTKRNDVEKVNVIAGDPYSWEKTKEGISCWKPWEKKEMTKKGSTDLFDYWETEIRTTFRRLKYGFELWSGEEKLIYTEKGFFEEAPLEDNSSYFTFPFLNEEDVF